MNEIIANRERIKKIFIRGSDAVGTFVLATPFYQAIRENFPKAQITLCVKPLTKELAETCPYVDRVLVYKPRNLLDRLRIINRIKKEKFDLAFLLSGSFESALLCRLAKIKYTVGYPYDYRRFLLSHVIEQKEPVHGIKQHLWLLESLGFKVSNTTPQIWITSEDEKFAEELFFKNKLRWDTIGIGFSVRNDPSRLWPLENFAKLIESIHINLGVSIALCGPPSEINTAEKIISMINKNIPVVNLTGKTSLRQFAAVVKKFKAYVSLDTGGMHIAAVVGTPVVALFGPEDPKYWGPLGKKNKILQGKVPCAPCSKYRIRKKCKFNKCMYSITPQDVFRNLKELLKGNG